MFTHCVNNCLGLAIVCQGGYGALRLASVRIEKEVRIQQGYEKGINDATSYAKHFYA